MVGTGAAIRVAPGRQWRRPSGSAFPEPDAAENSPNSHAPTIGETRAREEPCLHRPRADDSAQLPADTPALAPASADSAVARGERPSVDAVATITEYLDRSDWRVNANANQGYSLGG